MKIAVVAANGRVAQKVIKEAQDRDFDVVGFGRGENKSGAATYTSKDIMELTKADLADFDVVVDGFGAWTDEEQPMHIKTSQHLCDLLSGTDTRLLVVGGAGSLFVDKEHTKTVFDVTPFPEAAVPVVKAHQTALDALREYDDVKWTYISPAGDFQAEGARTGKYLVGGEELILSSKGESVISYADYAIAMIDEAVSGDHIKQRIGVVKE